MSSAKQIVLDSDNLRSFSVFFGTGEESAYSLACNPTVLCPRLKNNLFFFYLNYILVAAVVTVIALLALMINPVTIIMVIVLALCWFAVIRSTSGDGLVLGSGSGCLTISRKTATTVMTIITAVVLFFMVQKVFVITLSSSGILALLHALVRDATEHIEGNKKANANSNANANANANGQESNGSDVEMH